MPVEPLPDADLGHAARALLDGHGAAGQKLADDARGDRHQLVLIGIDRHQPEAEREPGDGVARHRADAAAIAAEQAAADEHGQREEKRHIAEAVAVEPGDHAASRSTRAAWRRARG